MKRVSALVGMWLLAGVAQAVSQTYSIDPSHTYPSFETSHMDISVWRGKFNRSEGRIELDRERQQGSVDMRIDAASIDFGHDKMNEHALSEDFFNVAKYPTATYKGKLLFTGDQPSGVDGQLTLLGVTKPVKLEITEFTCIIHPFIKKEDCGGDAYGEFNRADFGMSKYADGLAGKVRLRIQVEAIKD